MGRRGRYMIGRVMGGGDRGGDKMGKLEIWLPAGRVVGGLDRGWGKDILVQGGPY